MTPDPLTPSPDSPTPRTDAALRALVLVGIKYGFSEGLLHDFAKDSRQLERENAALAKEREDAAENEKAVASKFCEIMAVAMSGLADAAIVAHKRYTPDDSVAMVRQLADSAKSIRATLAERDREVSGMKEQAFRADEEIRAATANIRNLAKEREELREELATTQMLYRSAVNSLPTMSVSKADLHVKHLRAEKERDQLRATLAERDDRISWLETQREVECKQKQDAFNERDGFAKELAETQEKLERALIDNNQLIAEKVNQGAEFLALQAHAGECRSVLKLVDATNERAYTAALKLLASQPDLPLIEEVRDVLEEVDKQIAVLFWTSDDGETIRDGRPQDADAPESFCQAWSALRQLLARLNPKTNPTKL